MWSSSFEILTAHQGSFTHTRASSLEIANTLQVVRHSDELLSKCTGLKPEWRSRSRTPTSSTTSPDGLEGIFSTSWCTNQISDAVSEKHCGASSSAREAGEPLIDDRQIIYLEDPADDIDFITLHNILYFIYIGCVNLPLPHDNPDDETVPEGYPDEPDPFRLYRNADKFLLSELKELCLLYLEHSITAQNVAERLFHPDCEFHLNLKTLYFDYLISNYEEVKKTEGWDHVVCDDEEISPSAARYRARLILDISKRLKA